MFAGFVRFDDDAGDHEGGTAEFKEVIRSTYLVLVEDGGEDVAEEFLIVVSRCYVVAVRVRQLRSRQRTFVHFLVLVQRDAVDLHGRSRHHVGWFAITDKGIECLDIDLGVADDISGDELTAVGIVKGLHSSVLDTRVLTNDRLDLFEFDTETANLDLAVLPSHKLDVSVCEVANDVTCSVAAKTIPVDIGLGGFVGTIEVTTADLRTGDEQFACCAYGHTVQVFINDKEPEVIQGFADRYVLLLLMYRVGRCEDGTLSRTVGIMELIVSRWRDSSEFFSSNGEVTERVVVAVLRKLIPHLSRHERMGDAFSFEVMVQIRQVQTYILADDINGCSAGECRIHIHHVGIEAIGRVRRHFVPGMEIIIAMVPMTERYKVAVLQLAAFGHAGGATCIKEDE